MRIVLNNNINNDLEVHFRVKVIVDRDVCQGIGNCVAIAPGVFELDEENKAVATHIEDISEEKIREAAESCPLDAIILQDDDGEQIYP